MDNSIEGYSSVGWKDQLIIFGGRSNGVSQNGTWIIKTGNDSDEAVAREVRTAGDIPQGKVFHTATVIDNKMYIIGGLPKNLSTLSDVSPVEVLDIPTMTWGTQKTTGSSPGPRCHHASCSIGNTIYTYGGYSLTDKPTDTSIFAYDTQSCTWSCLVTKSLIPLWGHTLESHGSKLVIFGGVDGDRERNVMYFYETKTGESRTVLCELLSDRVGVVKATHQWTPSESDKNRFMSLKEGDIISVMRDGSKPVPGWKRGFKLPNDKGWFPATRVESIPSTKLLALHEIPPSATLLSSDIGTRLQIKETGQVLVVKEDYSGYTKVPPDAYTESEIAYQPTKFHPVPFPRALHSSCSLPGGIFIWSGEHSKNILQDGWRLDFSTGTWKYLGSAKSESLPQSGTPCVFIPEYGRLSTPSIVVPILSQNKMLKFDVTYGEWGSVPLSVISLPVAPSTTEVLTPPLVREEVEMATPVREAVPVPVMPLPVNVQPVQPSVPQPVQPSVPQPVQPSVPRSTQNSDPPILQGQGRMISPRPPSPSRVDWMSPARIRPPITKTSGFNIPFSPYERTPEGYLVMPQEQSPQISHSVVMPSPQVESPRDWMPSSSMSASPPHVHQLRRMEPTGVDSRERSTSITSLAQKNEVAKRERSTSTAQQPQTPKRERSTSTAQQPQTPKQERSTSVSSLVQSDIIKRERSTSMAQQNPTPKKERSTSVTSLTVKRERSTSMSSHVTEQQLKETTAQQSEDNLKSELQKKEQEWKTEKQQLLQQQADEKRQQDEQLLKVKNNHWEAEKDRIKQQAAQEKIEFEAKIAAAASADALQEKEHQWKQELEAIQRDRDNQRKKYTVELEKLQNKEKDQSEHADTDVNQESVNDLQKQQQQLAEHEKQWDREREQLLKERLDLEDKKRELSNEQPKQWGEWQSPPVNGREQQQQPNRYDDELLIRKEPGAKVGLTWKGDMLLDVTSAAAAEQGAENFINRRLTHIGAVPITAISSVKLATRDMANVRFRFSPRVEGITDQVVRSMVRDELNRRTPRRSASRTRSAVSSPKIRNTRHSQYSPARATPSPKRGEMYRSFSPATRQTCSSVRKRSSFNSVDPPYIHPHTASVNGSTPRRSAATPARYVCFS